jgi:uncharacterized OB-fold protein
MRKRILDKDILRLQKYTLNSIKCKTCGHTILPIVERGICNYCGHWFYRNNKIEFKYKMLESLRKYNNAL